MITSVHNPLIKQLRQLGEGSKYRQKQQQILLEGTHLLQEAIATNYPLKIVCHTERWQMKERELYEQLLSLHCQIELVADHVLNAIATTLNPDGVIATAPLPQPPNLQIKRLGLALESIQDPGNMGTIVRAAAAAGCDGILIGENCVDLTNPKILRATAGQWFRSVLKPVANLKDELLFWQSQGVKLVGTSAQADVNLWQYDFSQPSLLILGNEGRGLSAEVLDLTDVCLSIPISPAVESLNVAMTATLLLFEAKRQSMALMP
ncbi:MAG: rRNA methyltransferase [Cyanobacteria bacterium M5B4]|nr:MAG: rRNA methyltransferase [Cyanobacteria bacterium M5B4]